MLCVRMALLLLLLLLLLLRLLRRRRRRRWRIGRERRGGAAQHYGEFMNKKAS